MPDSPAPRKRWFLKGLAILGQLLGALVLLAALVVIVREQIPWTLDAAGADERWQRVALTAATIVALLCGLRHGLRRPRQIGRALVCFAITAIAGWLWLAWDDPKLDFPPEDYLTAADSPEAEASHALVLRYRSGEDSRLPADLPDLREPHSLAGNKTPTNEQWTAFVTEHRAEIQQGWDQLADHRAWIAEMAAAPRLADLTTSITGPFPSFESLRTSSRFMTWQARALALEGRGDEALAEIGTLLGASQKLIPHSRTILRRMIAIVLQRLAINTANFVLDSAKTSPEARARLLALVSSRPDASAAAYNLLWCEYPLSADYMLNDNRPPLEAPTEMSRLYRFANKHSTINAHAKIVRELSQHASRRDIEKMENISDAVVTEPLTDLRLKNLPGRLLVTMATPAFTKITDHHWQTEDLAAALEARLRAQ